MRDKIGNPIPKETAKFLLDCNVNPSDVEDIEQLDATIVICQWAADDDPRWTLQELVYAEVYGDSTFQNKE